MRVLVVGASGFLGQEVLGALKASGAADVVAGVRDPGKVRDAGVEARVLDVGDAASVLAAAQGMTHIVNSVMGSSQTMLDANRGILAAAERTGARVVQMSSIAVFGDAEGHVNEDAPQTGAADWYGLAKRQCEVEAKAAAGRGQEVVILRPGLIYGPGSHLWTGRIGRFLAARRLGDLGPAGEGVCNLVYVADVAKAVVAAMAVPVSGAEAFNLEQPSPPTWNAYLKDFADVLGVGPARRISSAQLLWERAGMAVPLKLLETVGGKLGMPSTPDPLTPGLARLFGRKVRYGGGKADRLLRIRWTGYDEGLAASADWFGRRPIEKAAAA